MTEPETTTHETTPEVAATPVAPKERKPKLTQAERFAKAQADHQAKLDKIAKEQEAEEAKAKEKAEKEKVEQQAGAAKEQPAKDDKKAADAQVDKGEAK